jgi:hypothetical protein
MAGKVRVTDLAAPRLNEAELAALEAADRNPPTMTVEAILAAAVEATGLHDFGDESFKPRLGLLLREVDANPHSTNFGRTTIYNECVRNAGNRLRNGDFLKRHPEVEELRLERPIIIVGLPRSGTTHLLNLIAADRRLRSMPLWESYQPIPDPDHLGKASANGEDPRLERLRRRTEAGAGITPYGRLFHTTDPEHVHEELELMAPQFTTYIYEWGGRRMPRWRDNYLATDQTPFYRYMRTMLKVLQWHRAGERWILKCPQHLEQLGPLMKVFPDATVVFTHRDPVAVVQSAAWSSTYRSRMNYTNPDPGLHLRYWVDRVRRLLLQSLRDRHVVPAEQAIDVFFDRFLPDQMGTVERIYEFAALPLTADARRQMGDYLEANAREREATLAFDLREDFGADPAEIRTEFEFYFDRLPVRAEVK